MARPSNSNLERELYELAFSDSGDFTTLARKAGLDPTHDFIGADLAYCDLANQDLREFNFEDADLRHCRFYKTILLEEHIRGAKFSSKKGFFVTGDRVGRIQKDEIPLHSMRYTDAIATAIERLTQMDSIEQKRNYLASVVAHDPRQSLQTLAKVALRSSNALEKPSIAIPFLMNTAISSVYPLARASLVDAYVRILGHNSHARAYLSHYYKKRAAGSEVTRILADYLMGENET
jgi:hypothetical protein